MEWIKYSDEKPKIGQEVLIYRDIESKQKYVTKWDEEEERWSDMNEITFWFPISDPNEQAVP